MSFSYTYRTLCSINLYHQYFLNDGKESFDNPAFPDLKGEQLEKYDFQSFMRIVPSERTKKLCTGQKIVQKVTKRGLVLWIQAIATATDGVYQPKIDLAQTETLDFLLYTTDPLFENYSTVIGVPDIPFFFSNKKPPPKLGAFKEINIETDILHTPVEDFTITDLTYKSISETLTVVERKGLFGIISLSVEADTAKNSLVDTGGLTQVAAPIFKVQLRNRETFWNYLDAKDGSSIHKSSTALPLVKNGIVDYKFSTPDDPAATANRASAQPNRLVFIKNVDGTIKETISEIFI